MLNAESWKTAPPANSAFSFEPTAFRMGLRGFGPLTSPLSGVRSNQLSYRPKSSLRCSFQLLAFSFQYRPDAQSPTFGKTQNAGDRPISQSRAEPSSRGTTCLREFFRLSE